MTVFPTRSWSFHRRLVIGFLVALLGGLPAASAQPGEKKQPRGSVKHSSSSRTSSSSRSPSPTSTSARARPGTTRGSSARRGTSRGRSRSRHYNRRYSARKDARRSWRRWRLLTGAIVIGTYYATRPKYTTTVVVTGSAYYYTGGVYYSSSGSGYVVVSPPPGAVVYAVPTATTLVYVGSTPYYYINGTYYVPSDEPATGPEDFPEPESAEAEELPEMTEDDHTYEVVAPPVGATVTYLPDEATEQTVAGTAYLLYDGTYYRAFISDGETIYMVVDPPT